MSFISTYSGGSIRGWQAPGDNRIYIQTQILTPNTTYTNQKYFGNSISISDDGNYIAVGETDFVATKTPGKAYIYNKDLITTDFNLQQEITPNAFNGSTWYQFGDTISINYLGSRVAVGAPGYNALVNATGAIYTFTRSGNAWAEEAIILTNDANTLGFPNSIDMDYSGNIIIAGAQYDNQTASQSGAVYVYTASGNTWTKTQKIKAGNIGAGALFGYAVCVSQDNNANYIVASAPGEGSNVGAIGSVYIFNKSGNTYVQQQKLTNPGNTIGDNFGRSLAINNDGNTLFVGCPNEGVTPAGTVYQYNRIGNTWTLNQTLLSPTTNNNDSYGSNLVCTSTSSIMVVADEFSPIISNTETYQGIAYIYQQLNDYIYNQSIQSNQAANNAFFGSNLSIDEFGNTLVVASGNANSSQGRVFIFKS